MRFVSIGNATVLIQEFLIEPKNRDSPFGKIKSCLINILTQAKNLLMKAKSLEKGFSSMLKGKTTLNMMCSTLSLGHWKILHGRKEAIGLLSGLLEMVHIDALICSNG